MYFEKFSFSATKFIYEWLILMFNVHYTLVCRRKNMVEVGPYLTYHDQIIPITDPDYGPNPITDPDYEVNDEV